MANPKAARRYAKAVFDLARDEGRLDAVRQDFAALNQLLAASPELRDFLRNRLIAAARRVQILGQLFEQQIDRLALRFLLFLEEKRRLALLPEILTEFERLADAAAGTVAVSLISAQPLDAAQVRSICDRLRSRYGKDVRATQKLDPSLLGGFQIQVGDLINDFSIETQLQALHRKFVTA